MATSTPPTRAQVVVLGGGPGGSYAASSLSRAGFEVVLLEAAKFPRYHIGESQLPSCRPFLRFIDCLDKIDACGFQRKNGAAVRFVHGKREAYMDFLAGSEDNFSLNVIRSQFDEVLLRHASASGARVFEQIRATAIIMEDPDAEPERMRPIRVEWCSSVDRSVTGLIDLEWLVDASGRNGLMACKYLKHRKINKSLENAACWGYFTETDRYGVGTRRENAPFFENLLDASGWAWFFPLHDGTTSVGIVMDEASSVRKKKAARANAPDHTLTDHFFSQLELAPGVKQLIGSGKFRDDRGVKAAADYSYCAPFYAGDHYRLVGDAASFIDPFLSSGVHLAFTGGLAAACSIASSSKGDCTEAEAAAFHTAKVAITYTRFMIVVMSAYQQMRNQDKAVLCDIDEDNFDLAFEILKPVIQGRSGGLVDKLGKDAMDRTMEYCSAIWYERDVGDKSQAAEDIATVTKTIAKTAPPLFTTEEINALEISRPNDVIMELKNWLASIDDFVQESHAGFKAILSSPSSIGLVAAA